MKVIFLDIDGVLNTYKFLTRIENIKNYTRHERDLAFFDINHVELLNTIISTTDAKIVISSSWRIGRNIQYFKNLFDSLDYSDISKVIIDLTDTIGDNGPLRRGLQIQRWIDDNKPSKYVIIDDDSDMLESQWSNFFKTSFYVGLTEEISNKIIKHLA